MAKRNYIVLCEERCCGCHGTGQSKDETPCEECEGRGFNQYPANLKKALVDLLFNGGFTDE